MVRDDGQRYSQGAAELDTAQLDADKTGPKPFVVTEAENRVLALGFSRRILFWSIHANDNSFQIPVSLYLRKHLLVQPLPRYVRGGGGRARTDLDPDGGLLTSSSSYGEHSVVSLNSNCLYPYTVVAIVVRGTPALLVNARCGHDGTQ